MWTISDKQIAEIESNTSEVAVLPCEQVEVMSLMSHEPTPLPPKEILRKRWLTEAGIEISSSLTKREVKIEVETNGFSDGEKLNIEVVDSTNKGVKNLQVTLKENRATTETFEIEEEWLNRVLFITFKS